MKNNLRALKNRILLWVVLIPLLSMLIGLVVLTVFIDGLFQDPFAKLFLYICQKGFGFTDPDAINLYHTIFRDNKPLWLAAGYLIIVSIAFYRAFSRLTRYFNEVNNGLDQLVDGKEDEIELSPEIDFIGKKLNRIKSTLKQRELSAQLAEQRKNDLVMYLAHDIKTPLTSIIGYLSLMEEAPDMPTEQRAKYSRITLDKAFRLEQLINEFFEITRYNLQTILLDKQEIDLQFMLLQMVDEFYPLLAPAGKTAEVHAAETILFYGDSDKLARVFNNIMKNAISYSYQGSVIHIDVTRNQKEIIISFTNKGNTIPPHKLDTIFEKFYRLDDARSSYSGGSGLGLAIAKNIIDAHGGNITVSSKDETTVFTVSLPV